MNTYHVYIVKCKDNSYYTGVTNDIERRIAQHNNGFDKSSYTFSRKPVELVFAYELNDIDQAIAFEKQLKGWSRKKKEAVIRGDWDILKVLAECKNESHYRNVAVGKREET
ncbi:GIY-YIG nuclease family protein [Dyadobacter luteus]|jgi:putative endonuclease|uniref:GIY-YIG nuclease family protein n=1 Tax=Dyadobacter luteus TaxID=2259619 RepID=A0A3D8Y2D8_9BACT|nr:GIY-YIG nuclease family protein [Dyadobacter luteus]REA55441.1 GIY-YIG nuclease family protein [Dyadobacter luteus]